MTIRAEIQSLSPTALLDFFVLDTTILPGGSVTRFHAGTNGLNQPVVWQGFTYEPLPIEAKGFDLSAKGALPRPKLKIANVGGFLSASVKSFNDFVGCKLTRKRTFAKYLDAINFRRDNLLLHSANLTQSVYFANGVTKVSADRITVDSITDPNIGQIISSVGAIAGRTFSAAVKLKGVNTSIGKYVTLYLYSDSANEVFTSTVGPLTPEYQTFKITRKFVTSTNTSIVFRLDPEAGSGAAWAPGDILDATDLQVNEGETLLPYQATGATWNIDADPNQFIPDDLWFVERKVSENRHMIEFELSSAFDLMGQQLPSRQIIQNSCTWKYRSAECGWAGAYYDKNNAPTSVENDACNKTLGACKVRFGTQPIRFGGFPGAVRGSN